MLPALSSGIRIEHVDLDLPALAQRRVLHQVTRGGVLDLVIQFHALGGAREVASVQVNGDILQITATLVEGEAEKCVEFVLRELQREGDRVSQAFGSGVQRRRPVVSGAWY